MGDEEPAEKKRRLNRERQQRWRAKQNDEKLERICAENADRDRLRRANETPVQTQQRLASVAINSADRRANETSVQTQQRLASVAINSANRRANETPVQTQQRLASVAINSADRRANETPQQRQSRIYVTAQNRQQRLELQNQALRNDAINFNEATVIQHTCGDLNVKCQYCEAKNFIAERPSDGKFTMCCKKGIIKLDKLEDEHGNELQYPEFLQELISNPHHPNYKEFRENIRNYNSAVSFASMGAKIVDMPGRGPYCFKIHGQIYHRTSHLLPINGAAPQYAQLYVIDSTQATEIRMNHPANAQCNQIIIQNIDHFLRQHNRYADSYRMLKEIELRARNEAIQAGEDCPTVNMVFRRDRQSDQRRYNAPTSNEIAMVFVNDDGEPPFERDIRIYPKNPKNSQQQYINLNILSSNLAPMTYPLLFPYGQPGWQPNWRCTTYEGVQRNQKRINITKLEYIGTLTSIRDEFNPILSAGKLTQQFIVDQCLQIEANNLNYIRQNQKKLRTELYQGLADHMANVAENAGVQAGVPVILPSSFEGSPRNMRERCADAMSIFAKLGPPDLFITFTANPQWKEIVENLNLGEQTSDRPDLVARVFKLKLKALIEDLTVHGVLGKCKSFVYSIEFQKRGLPHAHILLTLHEPDKFTTIEKIDQVISAEIPDVATNPRLHEIVTRCMMHGPCGCQNPHAVCMEDGKCKKQFPKQFAENTLHNVDGYPLYRRRQGFIVQVRRSVMDNRYVVPYNPFLLLKFNAHINVECCTSLRAVKYIYKYIYKGFDCANLYITPGENPQLRHDELANYINTRYVSAPEAMWRIIQGKMHDRSHVVIRLPVHLQNQQQVRFQEGNEQEALDAARTGRTKLESWFLLNQTNNDAHQLLYTDIPMQYVYVNNKWQKRQRGESKTLARMYTVGIKDEERFYFRMLLLHVPGATSFEFLRTIDGVLCETYKQAAYLKGLLDSDDEWDKCLEESATYQMPHQMRQTFAYICCFCIPTNALNLWVKHQVEMSLDFQRHHEETIAKNLALHDIDATLKQHGLSCGSFGLPIPIGNPIAVEMYNHLEEKREADERINLLRPEQLAAFEKIVNAIENENEANKCFYLDGPGGSGKTFIYSTLLAYVRGKCQIALPYATTGIAGTLLKGGRTVHSGFKLPVPLLDTSVSSMRPNSNEADIFRQASLIIIDEITMLTKHGIRCIDKLLRDIMRNDKPFGGKILVIGGDFRQTLPVVVRGTRTDIIECCIKSSPLWQCFKKLTLTANMRSEGMQTHNDWLLAIGTGTLDENTRGIPINSIQIPNSMIVKENLISEIFGTNVSSMPVEELSKRAILAPTNKDTLEINREIINSINGKPHIYYSSDKIISEDPSDENNYPPEFLHDQTPSGMPPHTLVLKVGVIIMLMRNLNPKKGLCNGTRMILKSLQRNFITAEIISECNRGDRVFIPRIDLAPSDTNLPFILKRRQFPIIPAYAMTINKSQGQTFERVGVHLTEPVFTHGQLYVSLTRGKNPEHLKVMITNGHLQGNLLNDTKVYTQNIVYKEIFQND